MKTGKYMMFDNKVRPIVSDCCRAAARCLITKSGQQPLTAAERLQFISTICERLQFTLYNLYLNNTVQIITLLMKHTTIQGGFAPHTLVSQPNRPFDLAQWEVYLASLDQPFYLSVTKTKSHTRRSLKYLHKHLCHTISSNKLFQTSL